MRILTTLLLLLIIGADSTAQQPPQGSPTEQALGNKLIAEISAGIQCSASVVTLQQQLAAVTKERDELRAKVESAGKVDAPAKK